MNLAEWSVPAYVNVSRNIDGHIRPCLVFPIAYPKTVPLSVSTPGSVLRKNVPVLLKVRAETVKFASYFHDIIVSRDWRMQPYHSMFWGGPPVGVQLPAVLQAPPLTPCQYIRFRWEKPQKASSKIKKDFTWKQSNFPLRSFRRFLNKTYCSDTYYSIAKIIPRLDFEDLFDGKKEIQFEQ